MKYTTISPCLAMIAGILLSLMSTTQSKRIVGVYNKFQVKIYDDRINIIFGRLFLTRRLVLTFVRYLQHIKGIKDVDYSYK